MSGPRFRGSFPLGQQTSDGRLLVGVTARTSPAGVRRRGENVGFVDTVWITADLVTVRGGLLRPLGLGMTEFVHQAPLYIGPCLTADIITSWDEEAMVMSVSGAIGGYALDDRPCWPGQRPIILGSAA